mgnify:CR=1 FL=1
MKKPPTIMIDEGVGIIDIFRFARDGFKAGSEMFSQKKDSNTYSYSSAAKAASKLIAVFPLLCSKSISSKTAQLMSKYIESKGCIILQLALQSANISNAKNGIEYMSKFHQNLNVGGNGIDVLAKAIDAWIDADTGTTSESTIYDDSEVYSFYDAKPVTFDEYKSIKESLENMHTNGCDSISIFDSTPLESYSVSDFNAVRDISLIEANSSSSNSSKDSTNSASILSNQDVKKMNNAIPTLLKVKFFSRENVGTTAVETSFLIGVKGIVMGCNADEILRRIVNDNSDGKFFFNFMRAFTGETRFVQDFLLALDSTDDDIMALKKKGAHGDVWKLLQNRAFAAKQAVHKGTVNPAAAITTVIISQDDAESLYKEENIDILNPKIARRFMDSYNLLGFGVVDDNNESLKIMFDDGNLYFEEISYKMLERESKNDDFVKAITLLAKSSR